MLRLETKADLDALYVGNVKESISLEYKASPSIDRKDDNKKLEMARDVSAFANADGGQIVYGMTENDHEPAGLDHGVDGKAYPEIWFEQVLQQHVTPPIQGLRIRHVPLAKPMVAVVIVIPAAKGDPHQVSDGRYYRRHNYNRLIMEHYEVRDYFRRVTSPELNVDFHFDKLSDEQIIRYARDESQVPAGLTPIVSNSSNQPALYAVISLFFDARLIVIRPTAGGYAREFETKKDDKAVRFFQATFNASRQMPIFSEQPVTLPNLGIVIPDEHLYSQEPFQISYEARAPGCFKEGAISLFVERGERLRLVRPG
jgi:hypothetical protein